MKTIENLPDEVLKNVFLKLDQSSLENAAKVCKRWMSIVTSNKSLLSKFSLLLLVKEKAKIIGGLNPSIYKSAKIFINNDQLDSSKRIEKVLKNHKPTLETLELRGTLKKYEIFENFLQPVNTITHLILTHIYPEEYDEEIFPHRYYFKEISLPHLKVLEILNCQRILHALMNLPNLEVFKIYEERRFIPLLYACTENYSNECRRIERGVLQFLKRLKKLKVLHLDGIGKPDIYKQKYDFKLEEVSLQTDYINEQILIDFLVHHKDTLKRAAVSGDTMSNLIQFLTKDCNLTYLDVQMQATPKDLKIEHKNFSIKQLELPCFPIVPIVGGCSLGPRLPRNVIAGPGIELLKSCVNVEELGLYDYQKDLLRPISEMKNLKRLKVYFPPPVLPSAPDLPVLIEQVETLEFDWIPRPVPYIDHLLKFLPLFTKVKCLKINKLENSNEEVFEKIVEVLPHLVELHLGTDLPFSCDMMHVLNDVRKKGYALNRLSFAENGNRAKEFASFRVENFHFCAHDEEDGFFQMNRFIDCDNRKFEKIYEIRKAEFDKIDWEIKKK